MTRKRVKTIQELFDGIPHTLKGVEPQQPALGLSDDSRKIKEGDIFIAMKGAHHDGHDFIKESLDRGAIAVCAQGEDKNLRGRYILVKDTAQIVPALACRFFDNPSRSLKVLGITGTNGKTTAAHLVYSIFRSVSRTPSLIGTIHHRIGDEIIKAHNTTPGSLELHSLFRTMKEAGSDSVVIEVSSHALAQSRVDMIDFSLACLTNVTGDHLDYHGSMTAYVASKVRLFEMLDKNATAVLNSDDAFYKTFERASSCNVLRYGITEDAEFKASDIELDSTGSRFFLDAPNGTFKIRTHLVGVHNVYNILAAVAIAFANGIESNALCEAVGNFRSVPGRLESVEKGQRFKVFIDYAHTHNALENVLSALRGITPGKLIAVFGCGGDRDRTKRPKMGAIATRYADYVILTNDNPRHEDPEKIIDQIEEGLEEGFTKYERIPDRRKAIEEALANREPMDTVLIAGKGHEDYQIIGDQTYKFNDREVIEEKLEYVYSPRAAESNRG